jgi:transcription-repair coupling factor (superfamily II helicase)
MNAPPHPRPEPVLSETWPEAPPEAWPDDPPGATAACLLGRIDAARGLLVIADGERRAAELAALMQALAPERDVLLFPGWDCLPHDRIPPSAAVCGARAAVLHRLARGGPAGLVVVAAPDTLVQRVPVADAMAWAPLRIAVGDKLDVEALVDALRARAYWDDERVDEQGEYSARGSTFDIFPAQLPEPVRITHEDGVVVAIRAYDPLTQRSLRDMPEAVVGCAREWPEAVSLGSPPQEPSERHPARWSGPRALLAELMPEATTVLAPHARDRALVFLDTIRDAAGAPGRRGTAAIVPSPALYADAEAFDALVGRSGVITLSRVASVSVPRFAAERHGGAAFGRFAASEFREGRQVVVSAPDPSSLRRALRFAGSAAGAPTRTIASLADLPQARPGRGGQVLAGMVLPATRGFRGPSGVSVVTAFDLLGSVALQGMSQRHAEVVPETAEWQVGDAIIDVERGLARLGGLETLTDAEGNRQDVIRLLFAHDEAMLLPVAEAGRLWRYGAAGTAVKPDSLHGTSWQQRRDAVSAEIAETARRLAREAEARRKRRAPAIEPPSDALERFAARFPFVETPDQASAIAQVLDDLASGRPMDRLVCGDVGFGKTEVALRAAAAVALSGRQVALVAPTTILARQHLKTLQRRFAGFGITVAELSRFVPPAEARETRAGLADGRIHIVVGTHAVAAKGVVFEDLGLMIVDEEQRFGEAQKARLRQLVDGRHLLTMTATPIPRTLQTALIGLRDVSRIATPPVARRPVRTTIEGFTPALLAEALDRERARGGQSFLVCPRIEDLQPLRDVLARTCPDLAIIMAHAKMPAAEIDAAMLAFAEGEGDCLLTTSIVESGLDVPNANTMLIWHPDRFGLAQLHQLRGRVGRGRATGFCILLTDPGEPLTDAAQRRLQTLAALDRPGAGFSISARDLDLRGAGDLFGEDQTGHLSVLGSELARHLAEIALRRARGEDIDEGLVEIGVADRGHIPEDYVPVPDERLSFHVRLARATDTAEVDAIGDEIEDRFGPLPEPVQRLLATAGLQAELRRLGLVRLDIGPQGLAATGATTDAPPAWFGTRGKRLGGAPLVWSEGRIAWRRPGEPATDLARARVLLKALHELASRPRAARRKRQAG